MSRGSIHAKKRRVRSRTPVVQRKSRFAPRNKLAGRVKKARTRF